MILSYLKFLPISQAERAVVNLFNLSSTETFLSWQFWSASSKRKIMDRFITLTTIDVKMQVLCSWHFPFYSCFQMCLSLKKVSIIPLIELLAKREMCLNYNGSAYFTFIELLAKRFSGHIKHDLRWFIWICSRSLQIDATSRDDDKKNYHSYRR